MDIGRPTRRYTIEPIRDPLKRHEPAERPAPERAPVRIVPKRAGGR